ncbi:MAG: hypothetical protein ACYTG7_23615 [Planctomycetota bacterium]
MHIRDDYRTLEVYADYLSAFTTYFIEGSLSGSNLHIESMENSVLDFGVFYKDESNSGTGTANPGSDTLALTIRDEISLDPLTITAEVVRQYGETRVVTGMIGTEDMNRRAWGGQGTVRLQLSDEGIKPYVRGRYAYFAGDRDSTRGVESFDPLFYGWNDWGTWWIGDMSSFQLPHSNARNIMVEFGCAPTDVSSLRFMYFNTRLDKAVPTFSETKTWSHEINIVYDYFFSDYVFTGVMLGAAEPRAAAEAAYGDDETMFEMITWLGFVF